MAKTVRRTSLNLRRRKISECGIKGKQQGGRERRQCTIGLFGRYILNYSLSF
jgi:hypothetical protein